MTEFAVWFVANLISTFGFAYLYCKLSEAKVKIGLFILFWIILGSIGLSLVRVFNITFLSSIYYFLFYPVLFYALSKVNLNKLLFYVLIIWLYSIILDFISMMTVLLLQNVFSFDIYSYVSRIILTIFVLFLLIILANNNKIKKFTNSLFKKVQNINYFDFALICFAIFILLTGVALYFNLNNLDMSVLLIILILLISFSFILLIRVRINLVESNIFLNLLKENNEFYLKIEDENRIFKHNLMAKLLSVKSVSGKKARVLIDDFIKSFNTKMDFSIQIKDMPYGLNGIIYEKIYPYIGKLHIKIYNKIDFDIFKKLKPRRYNVFVEKMIIALDNAIESCITSSDKILVINLYFENNNIVMDIKNTFSADLNLEELGNINYSTKGNGRGKRRGLGLFSALRDNEVKMSIKIINNLFVSKIVAKQNLND